MATDQIRQMVNFILQEAHEKANEIRVKVGSCWSVSFRI
jgi:vacuolar-type H+-ATPase subunit E/Vma4